MMYKLIISTEEEKFLLWRSTGVFVNFAYATNKNTKGGFWSFDTTLNVVGKQRLPNTVSNPVEFQLPMYSETYTVVNAQISRNFNQKIRAYFGGET